MHRSRQKLPFLAWALLVIFLWPKEQGMAAHLYVGAGHQYQTVRDALNNAQSGDTILIEEGLYEGETAVIQQNDLRIIGLGSGATGRPRLIAPAHIPNGKAIWVIRGDNIILRNLDLSGARVPHLNGAAIRHEGGHLQIENSIIHHNQMGIMTANHAGTSLSIINSTIHSNHLSQAGRRIGHNIYVGQISRFELRGSHVYNAWIGHNVKSRARDTLIRHTTIEDSQKASSYLIDLPNGGRVTIDNCVLKKGVESENNALISFGSEGLPDDLHTLTISNTLAQAEGPGRILLRNHSDIRPEFRNNELVGLKPFAEENSGLGRYFRAFKTMIRDIFK
ncbi:right-handed parallel beta-helix repeat-containing protein [Luteithermobacter gelatinilyticus]|uniref:right-handed parallel beta-helix repeat-containing protein n=1 Tax=Luteithermobacter gelatinilyticus TaxID=2582913 RepID=UPI001105B7F4|nr:right-handed parallel beta-helix repeat-containing protein [Luteithermobacter gelatinilyticus]